MKTKRLRTPQKPKYNEWNWLLFTQFIEVVNSKTPEERVKELADIISVAMEDIDTLGFDPPKVYEERMGEKGGNLLKIFNHYARHYRRVMREIKEWP